MRPIKTKTLRSGHVVPASQYVNVQLLFGRLTLAEQVITYDLARNPDTVVSTYLSNRLHDLSLMHNGQMPDSVRAILLDIIGPNLD